MAETNRRVAIACQGGGSHTAFSAGALKTLLKADGYEFVAFTGTSGGAIDTLLAWYGLLRDGRESAGHRLEAFWRDVSAGSLPEFLLNHWAIWSRRALGTVVAPEISPYLYPPSATQWLKGMLKRHVDFGEIPDLVRRHGPATPMLLVAAVEVRSGKFTVFKNAWDSDASRPALAVTAEAILASAAVPTLSVQGGAHRRRCLLGRAVLAESTRP